MPHHPSISHTTPKEPNLRQEYEEGLSPHSKSKRRLSPLSPRQGAESQ